MTDQTTDKWTKQFVVYCDTPAQKAQLEAQAGLLGRTLSRYVLLRALSPGGEEAFKERALRAEEDRDKWRTDYYRAKADAEEVSRRMRELEAAREEMQRQLDMARIKISREDTDYDAFDARILQILANARDGDGRQTQTPRTDPAGSGTQDSPRRARTPHGEVPPPRACGLGGRARQARQRRHGRL